MYRGHYYKLAGETELEEFLAKPDKYTHPGAPNSLPPSDLLPVRRSEMEVKMMFPQRFEIQGYCPVSYVDGNKRYPVTLTVCILYTVF